MPTGTTDHCTPTHRYTLTTVPYPQVHTDHCTLPTGTHSASVPGQLEAADPRRRERETKAFMSVRSSLIRPRSHECTSVSQFRISRFVTRGAAVNEAYREDSTVGLQCVVLLPTPPAQCAGPRTPPTHHPA
ncbi:hypothetical protein Hamer_G029557 [Homarus americanus]|uniref:Uncharacterized protein n=1 Tax=Homarus americanus TaxID=6706 RepID=A0A8J5N8Q4_HOMAM|nr:hypothetical protein Hamer_G029557 [Homarus americanus]